MLKDRLNYKKKQNQEKMIFLVALLAIANTAFAGRASYLGGDIDQYAEISKKSVLYPKPNRPITARQLEAYKNYQSKFSDIAKAYSEGYKAAIKAVQARAAIAQRRLRNYKKSEIPKAPKDVTAKDTIPDNLKLEDFKNSPHFETVTGTEKSEIPLPRISKRSYYYNEEPEKSKGFHRGVPSISLSEEKRAEISRLNAAALHRNVYMDNMGGLSYGGMGGVLSRQKWIYQKKHRRSIEDENDAPVVILRHRRSRMPYLGQNLDRLGVVRVKPNWDEPATKKNKLPTQEITKPQVPHAMTPAAFHKQVNPYMRQDIPSPWQQSMNAYNQYPGPMMYPNPYGYFMMPNQFQQQPAEKSNNEEKLATSSS